MATQPHTDATLGTSTALANSRIGSTVAGKYRLHRLIGKGAIGAVYAAVHQFTNRHVALKVIDASVANYEGFATRFLREARAAADIGHPVICDVVDAGQEPDGTLYLALELLEGRTFEAAIEANDLRLDEIVDALAQLLDGLAAAHDRGIVHRDIKPENIFLTWNASGELHVKLLDFGVAKSTNSSPEVFQTQQGAILGTPYYMAPEQAAGDPVDARADIWAAGAVLFHALTGRPPHDESTYNRLISKLMNADPPRLHALRPDLPEWLAVAVDGALQREVEARWQSARTMADTLRLRGRAPIELDWEIHEDATVRTDSPYSAKDTPAAIRMLSGGAGAPESIEVDLDQIDLDAFTAANAPGGAGGGPTIKTDVPPEFLLATYGPKKKKGSGIWLGILLGVLITTAIALVAGWFLYQRVLASPPAATQVE